MSGSNPGPLSQMFGVLPVSHQISESFPLWLSYSISGTSAGSDVDPNKLNSDPDPEFWPNLDPDPRVIYQLIKKC